MFFRYVDQSATKNDIRDALMYTAEQNGETLSKARADKLANKFKRGEFDPDLARYIQYSDPVGETAARNVDAERFAANHLQTVNSPDLAATFEEPWRAA